ncbi:protein adenylyltransferase SelO [Desulforhopalus singaporensis]|uniref:Protein nucleotidyltransferase YdiU n=1 Tax=Desulforhopalus singaporensis TaxID=91360 RepID=A0A1H0LY71_9BACT|nr:YdiU family protein [Desulforhopalus singaporensis]SDO73179.1 Uncharacterized conserved protein YdiU, UPF0061 family [Desulforhopalus singaporensis]
MSTTTANTPLTSLNFDNSFTARLPADPELDNYPRQVYHACYSRVKPAPADKPRLVAYSSEVAKLIGLDPDECCSALFRDVFVGNTVLDAMEPFAMCYGGHQFGNWAGQLGDGRAINLGEVVTGDGTRWMLQLKGAGLTPYSRRADGLAVLRSSIREFLCSEAMHHLKIPTTRGLSLITTGELVTRDMFYDGHPRKEQGAVVCRVSPSFTRFGNFEIHTARNDIALLKQLVDYTIETDFPHLGPPSVDTYLAWFAEICETTAAMIVDWMRVGFVHGVMNTDNMSILGLTIDYGPYGWLEGYEPDWTPNTTDSYGRRYSYKNQPHIGQWNLAQLANAIYPLIGEVKPLEDILAIYSKRFLAGWNSMMAAKLGLSGFVYRTDDQLLSELLDILQRVETDMTIFFRNLAKIPEHFSGNSGTDPLAPLMDAYYFPDRLDMDYRALITAWLEKYVGRLDRDSLDPVARKAKMNSVNPKYVLRNYLAQMAIDRAEVDDPSMIEELLELLKHPYEEQPSKEKYAVKRPEWARHKPGCSMLSCSS